MPVRFFVAMTDGDWFAHLFQGEPPADVAWVKLVIAFLGGAATMVFVSYLSWMGEVRRRGFEAHQEMHAAARKAAAATVRFVANAGGMTRINWAAVQRGERDSAHTWYVQTTQEILNFRAAIDGCSLFLTTNDKGKAIGVFSSMWDFVHDTGKNPSEDYRKANEFYKCAEQIGQMAIRNFLSARGFLKHVFLGLFK